MNEILRLISKSLKPFGYHLRPFKAPNILRLAALERETPELAALQSGGYWTQDADLDRFVVYFRTCIRKNRNVDTRERVSGASVEENTLRCLNSLVTASKEFQKTFPTKALKIVHLDDNSDADSLAKIESLLEQLPCPYESRQTDVTGQGESLHQQFREARDLNALVYFCEDDYLHEPDALSVMMAFYETIAQRFGTYCMIYPQEHPVLYDNHYPSYLITGIDRHWRSMAHATHTFVIHSTIVRDFWQYFENTKYVGIKKKRKLGSEARTTNKLFKHIPGFSPLKPAAVHLQFEATLPPLYDWKPLWKENAISSSPAASPCKPSRKSLGRGSQKR